MLPKNVKNLMNIRFDRLEVLDFVETCNKVKRALWLCLCDCGNLCEVYTDRLTRGQKKSCGCLPKGRKCLDNELAAFNKLYYSYKNRANKKNLDFKITKKYFKILTLKPCYYCKSKPSNIFKHRKSKYIYNGIDRLNNIKGYISKNCVSCCFICNRAKSNLTYKEFNIWLNRIKKRRKY